MSMSGKIKSKYKRPLGDVSDVQEALKLHFPGIKFVSVSPVNLGYPWGWNLIHNAVFLINILFNPPHKSSYLEGNFSSNGQGWGAQFDLGETPIVQSIRVTLYGSTASADEYFAKFDKLTGWKTRF